MLGIITIDDCMYSFQDNRVTLQLMLISPYVADLKQTVEVWMKNLEQLEEILDLWVACQRKVNRDKSILNHLSNIR